MFFAGFLRLQRGHWSSLGALVGPGGSFCLSQVGLSVFLALYGGLWGDCRGPLASLWETLGSTLGAFGLLLGALGGKGAPVTFGRVTFWPLKIAFGGL